MDQCTWYDKNVIKLNMKLNLYLSSQVIQQVIAPWVARRYAPADGSSTRGGSTSVRGRVRSPHTAELQAASVPIAQGSCAPTAAAPRDRQTDGRIAVSLNAPYGGA